MIEISRLRRMLVAHAQRSETTTYAELAQRLQLSPPRTIGQVAQALEAIMEQDAVANEPLLSAVVVQRAGNIPRAGFFQKARTLGLYEGPDDGPHAELWHLSQREKLQQYWQTYEH
ncbi:hypothetical protein [Salinibius halmophilus]|uniref:hypothetical protein n=1 Tax=Salinibius halmophilus TaxID=1853216 RepID=UPI000E66FA58|nr:hypothetical protein [Salinibius halmophilus]